MGMEDEKGKTLTSHLSTPNR